MAESGDEKLHLHLKRYGLTDKRWFMAFQRMNVTDPDNIKDKENMFALLSVMATASESVGLRKALGISSAVAKIEKVDGILKEGRLESEYWSKVLSKQFGVVSAQGFGCIPQDISFPHLVQFARSFDEYKNIKELLRINDEEKEVFELYKKFMVGFRDRASEMKEIIDQIEQFYREGKMLQDKEVQTMCSNALESMQIPKEFWLSVTAYETFLKSLKHFHNFIIRVPGKDEMLLQDSKSVIQQSSNGLALKGVLIQGSDEPQSLESITLAVPEGIELKLPIYPQHIKKVFCIGKDEEEEALKKMNNFKISVIGNRGRVSSKKYCSTTKQFVVPLASCCFAKEQLKLSENVVSKLKVIENSKVDSLLKECENFLKEFGSHVCLGPFHFGGSYLWHCYTCDIKKQTDFVAAETLQKEAIQFYGSLFEIPIHPTINEEHMSFPREILKRTYIKISTSGGMTHPTSVALWRNRLMVDHLSWVLLDCGQEYYPIWDIVENNHQKHFKRPSFLAKALQAVWKQLKPNPPQSLSIETNDLFKKVHGWIKSSSINIQENLLFLVRQRELVTKERNDIRVWPKHYLTLPYVQKYVMLVVGKVSMIENDELKGLLRQIVSPADIVYIKEDSIRAEVLRVVYKTDQQHAVMELKDIMSSVKLSFELALGMFSSSISDIEALLECVGAPQTAMEATTIIKSTICYLKDHFERTHQVYDELYVDTLLFPFKYTTDHTYFYMRGRYDVECLSNLFQMHTKRFYEIKTQQSIVKIKAFLILLTIDIYNNMDVSILSKTNAHLEIMYEHFVKNDASDSVVEKILSEIIENNQSFESAKTALQHIILASSNEVEAVTENLDKVFSASSSGARLAPQPKLNDFELMLSFFHLAKYYPQKMTLLQALEVREGLVCDGQICSDHTVYPFLIIQRIMAFDHRCFIRLVDSSRSFPLWHKVKKAKFINLRKSLQNKKIVTDINPLDGLVTVLLCADNFLRQELMWRLATCQIAIPLILPDPKTDILTLTLWAMRTIIKQWESIVQKKSYAHEVSIISYPTPIVSFVRFGCHKHSKSKLINVIMNDFYHDTFFNYDCDGGTAKKVAAQGLVDIAWYLPSTTNKAFHDAVAFVNLHGDARNFQRQVEFLSEISLMHFVFVNEKDLDKEGCETLQTLSKAPGGAVILQTEKTTSKAIYSIFKGYHVEVLKLEEENEAGTKTGIRKAISSAIQKFWCGKEASIHVLETCHAAARRCDIVVDEDDVSCAEGKRLADKFKLIIDSLGKKTNPKDQLVLQGPNYWQMVAKKEKEIYRPKNHPHESVPEYTLRLSNEIETIWRKQYEEVVKGTEGTLLNSFLTSLDSVLERRTVRKYYLQWLRLLLDDISRQNLPELHRQYEKKRIELKKTKTDQCKQDMEKLNMKITNASFGLEHLLREMGQVYQAAKHTHHAQPHKYAHLPCVAAELLIDGYPLELMDGDAAHVPIYWVLDVLKKVQAKLNNPKILVISILGLQSSGKSTLLNTVFGGSFNVSAGRCTRGAFMQLLPVQKNLLKDCNYLLLVDTEGLRASELYATQQTHSHDNQLATFVIGLAKLTVINIYGEVPADMNDILQTAVHAFLRMKHVSHLSPGCHFVHQNVTSVMASDKGMMGRGKMKENLDQMTLVAAKEEKVEKEYTSFSDVITYDEKKDFSYFPSLWLGDPSMAPVNPSYSIEAICLRNHLIACVNKKRKLLRRFSDFIEYFKIFWKAILRENFIFSFKNTLEMSAFSILDSQRSHWHWIFRKSMISWEDNFETAVCNYRGTQPHKLYETEKSKLSSNADKKHAEIMHEMKMFFEDSPDREILINWKVETERLFNKLYTVLKDRALEQCEQVWQEIKAQEKISEIRRTHHYVISEKVRTLVSSLDPTKKSLEEPQLKEKFEEQWKEWIKDLKMQAQPRQHQEKTIERDVYDVVVDHFKMSQSHILKKLDTTDGGKPLEMWGSELCLTVEEKHIEDLSKHGMFQSWFFWAKKEDHWRELAEKETKIYLKSVEDYLKSKQDKDYHPSFVAEVLHKLKEEIDNFESVTFRFSSEYRMDMALTACGYAIHKFKEMAERYRSKHDPMKCLEAEKARHFQHFKDYYMKTEQEVIAARHCCEVLEVALERKVIKSLCITVVDKMEKDKVNSFLFTKPALIRRVLGFIGIELKDGKFDGCYQYLRHPMSALKEHIKSCTETYCDSGHPCSNLTSYAREILTELLEFVKSCVKDITMDRFIIDHWIEQFIKAISERLIIDHAIVFELGQEQHDHDIEFFTAELVKGLNIIEETLKDKLVLNGKDMETWGQKPYDMIFDRVSGCKAACPFCREPCNNTCNDHDGDHTVKLHRPVCLGGWRNRHTGIMALNTCTEAVAEDRYFYVRRNSDEKHPFRSCEVVYPKWHIQEDLPGEASLYWKYVVAHFKGELARLYNMKEDSVPDHWLGFELSQAIEQLQD